MDDATPDRVELERALRDERSMRHRVEQRNADLAARVELWRNRADERTARIRQLEAERDIPWLRRLRKRIRRIMRETDREPAPREVIVTTEQPAPPRLPPRLPIVRVAGAVSHPGLRPVLETSSPVALDGIAGADVALVEPAAYERLPTPAKEALAEWSGLIGRQPLVVWCSDRQLRGLGDLIGERDLVAAGDATDAGKLAADLGRPVRHAPPSFDPNEHNPQHRRPTGGLPPPADLAEPTATLIRRAARGDAEEDSTGVALRRWAYRNHAPWVRARELFESAGLAIPAATDPITAILVSNRPDHVVAAATRILEQRSPGFRLVVGLHGFAAPDALRSIADSTPVPVDIHVLPERLTLGECLNTVIAVSPGRVLAKIDDDDYYGPSYLDDALQAMAYTDAQIVGKGAHYTYLAGADRTVLRRPRLEEQVIETMTTGASLVFARSVWDAVRFPHKTVQEDTWFLGAARAAGATVYANTRFEFTYVRSGEDHTWQTEEQTFETGAVAAWDGLHPEKAFVTDLR